MKSSYRLLSSSILLLTFSSSANSAMAFQDSEVKAQTKTLSKTKKTKTQPQEREKKQALLPSPSTSQLSPSLYKATQGSAMGFSYANIPPHEGLKISFKVHFVGPWDGSGIAEYGPDRFIAKMDDKLYLLDATFNNCQLVFAHNIWQSYPDPHQYRQQGKDGQVNFLYHGGEGAKAISSQGFKWNKSTSMDSSYSFSYTVSHKNKQMDLSFFTNWVEDDSVATYWIEDLKVEPITKLKELSASREEHAWLSFLRSDGHKAQKAWAEVYAAHPEKFIARVNQLMNPDPERVNFLIKQLGKGKGKIPTRSIQKEVLIEPSNKHAKQILRKIYYLRELALTQGLFSTKAGEYAYTPETTSQIRAIRKTLVLGWSRSILLEQISLRISGYLRMINTREAHSLAAKFDSKDPEFATKPIQPFLGTWKDIKDDHSVTIKQNGLATDKANNSGTWKFSKDDLVIHWKNGDQLSLLLNGKQCSATLTHSETQEVSKKTFLKAEKPDSK